MKAAHVYQQKQLAGSLTAHEDGSFSFTYTPDYRGEPVSLTMPVAQQVWKFSRFPAPFEGLLPEGMQLEALLRHRKRGPRCSRITSHRGGEMRCLITNEPWTGCSPYSPDGLKQLDRRLQSLAPLPHTREQLIEEAATRAVRMSIQGMQPKVSTVLRVKAGRMEITNHGGRYIVKPPHMIYAELPENEALTMSLAATLEIEVPLHGLLLNADGTRSYFIKRFDRAGRARRPVEDFAQLSGESRDTKYNSSTERLIEVIDRFCTFPALERMKFFDRMLFAFLTGNEDMHLKNWSLITRDDKVELSPAYDLLNTTIPNPKSREELALTLHGKKARLTANDFWRYLARERLGLAPSLIEQTKNRIGEKSAGWQQQIINSFLSNEMKERYLTLLTERRERLGLA